MKGFVTFVREQGIVGLAVGFLLGGSVSKVVSSLVEDIVNPLLGLVLGGDEGITSSILRIGSAEIKTGHFLSVLIDFAVVAFVVYYVVKGLRFDRLDKKKE